MTTTLRDMLEGAASQLRDGGIDDPRREARKLAQFVFGMSAASVIAGELDPAPEGALSDRFREVIRRRAAHEPLQHIVGTTEFYGLELVCDGRALIPRADSEIVVDAALECLPAGFDGKIADLGTGSGCLLLALLSQRPTASGIGLDASAEAAALAQENLQRLGLQGRAEILVSNWENWDGWRACDLVISNPPYIETAVIGELQTEVRMHDPHSALDGGKDGLDAYRSILACGAKMRGGTSLVMEIGYDQGDSVPELAESMGFELQSVKKDLGGNPRAISLTRSYAE